MARAKYQVLVLPYQKTPEGVRYCVFRRSDSQIWQFIAGGGETEDASVLMSAQREAWEEAGIEPTSRYTALETRCSIATEHFSPHARAAWGEACLVIPEYSFAVEMPGAVTHSREHSEYRWVGYDEAYALLRYDSNRVALWELDQKLRRSCQSS